MKCYLNSVKNRVQIQELNYSILIEIIYLKLKPILVDIKLKMQE